MRAAGSPSAGNLAPLQVVRAYEEATWRCFPVERDPQTAREKVYAIADRLSRSIARLTLEYAHGCRMDMRGTLDLMPRQVTTLRDYPATAGRGL